MTAPTDTSTGSDDPAYREAVGRAIKVLRTERGLERKELAAASGLSYAYLSEIETGRKRASSKALFVIADALGVRPAELLALGDRYASRSNETPPPADAALAQETTFPPVRTTAPSSGPPRAALAPAPVPAPAAAPRQGVGSGRPRWRWFERDVSAAPGEEAAPVGFAADASVKSSSSSGAPDSARDDLVERLVRAAERLPEDDLAALVDLARRLGRDSGDAGDPTG
jgi:transcriptional regulator with XRE-family HTH domain